MAAKYAARLEKAREITAAAELGARTGVIYGGRYAAIKLNAAEWAPSPAACSTPTLR
jgi:hypothetical protein